MAKTGRPRLKHKRSTPVKTLTFPEDAAAFVAACEQTKNDPPDVLRELIAAWVKYVEENPRATLHFRLVEIG